MQPSVPLDPAALAQTTVELTTLKACRIFSSQFVSTPLGTGAGDSRFAWRHSAYQVLYCAVDFRTAFLETVVRDDFVGKQGARQLPLAAITKRCWANLQLKPDTRVRLLDLRKDGCVLLGIPTDAPRSKDHQQGRELGQRLYDHHRTSIDGVVFASRFTGRDVYAIFSHACSRLSAKSARELVNSPELPDVMKAYSLRLSSQ